MEYTLAYSASKKRLPSRTSHQGHPPQATEPRSEHAFLVMFVGVCVCSKVDRAVGSTESPTLQNYIFIEGIRCKAVW